MAIIEEFVLKIKAKTDDLIRGGNEVERQKRKLTDDQKKRDKEEEKRRKKELDHNKVVKKDLLERIKYTKDLALKITGLGAIFSAVGIAKVTDDTLKQADALQFLSKETGIAATKLKALQDANRLGGGTAEGMTEAVKSAANDVAMYRLKGRSFSSLQGSELLAMYGYQAGMTQKDWEEALSGDAEKFLAAKMRVVSWVQKQSKEKLRGVDPRQAASQLALEAGMSGVLNATQDYERFQQNVAKRQLKAKQWESPNVRQIREELTGLQIDLETITSSVVLQAFAPEIHKLATAMGELKPEDVDKFVKKVQELVKTLDELVVDIYKISQDEDTKTFFKETGAAVGTVASGVNEAVKGTIGWKNAIEGLLALRLLVFFGSLAGVIGLGAGAGVTGAFLAVAAAIALVDKNINKVGGWGEFAKKLGIEEASVLGSIFGTLENGRQQSIGMIGSALDWATGLNEQGEPLKPNSQAKMPGNQKQLFIQYRDYLKSKGIPEHAAVGMLSNIGIESSFNPKARDYLTGTHHGLAQWDTNRQRIFSSLPQFKGKKILDATWQEQLDFLLWELNNTEKKAGDAMKQGRTSSDVAAIMREKFERPANPGTDKMIEEVVNARARAKNYEKISLSFPNGSVQPMPAPIVDKGQYNQLPPTGAKTTNNNAGVTMTNTFNIASTEPKAAAKEVGKVLDSFANFTSPMVNTFNGGYSE